MPRDTDGQALVAPWPTQALWLVEQAEARGTLLFIARNEARLDQLAGAAPVFAGGRVEALVLPPWDVLPYDRIPPSAGVVGRRVRALSALARPRTRPRLVLTCADAALQRVRPPGAWKNAELVLTQGEALDFDVLRAALAERGYQHLDHRVDEPGEVAIRGQVIDVFPAGHSRPVRLSVEPADGSDGRIHRAGLGGILPRPSRLYLTPGQAWAGVADRLLPVDAPGTPVKPPRRVDTLLDLARTAAERGDRMAIAAPEAPERVAASLARRAD